MNMAKELSALATCPRRDVGVIITDWENKSVSFGYNGSPSGMSHCIDVGCSIVDDHCSSAVHAEINAILNGDTIKMHGGSIYIYGGAPCYRCAQAIITVKLKYVYHSKDKKSSNDQLMGAFMLSKAEIIIQPVD